MTQIHFQETEGIGPSARVWKKINCPHSSGFFRTRGEGNPALGFYDDFIKTSDTSLEDGYIRLQTATGTVTQVASEATAPGIVQLATPADNDEAVIQLGNGIDVGPFRLQKDFAFEDHARRCWVLSPRSREYRDGCVLLGTRQRNHGGRFG
jgi:hypothetical protein